MLTSNEISLKQGDDVGNNEGKVAEFLNNAYINVVENTASKKPLNVKNNVTFSAVINTTLENTNITLSVLNIRK